MTAQAPPPSLCVSCGGPDDGEFVFCKFCKRPYSAEIAAAGIPCPACRTACRWGKQKCGACGVWIVVSCVFCGALSPHNQSACLACREAFAGAAQRKAQRDAAAHQQQNVQTYGAVGNVAASFLGAMAGGAVMSELGGGYHGHYHPAWDGSNGSYGQSSHADPPIGGTSGGAVSGDISSGGFTEMGGSTDGGDGGSSDGGSSDGSDGGSSDGASSDGGDGGSSDGG